MRHETLAGVSFETLEDIRLERVGSIVCDSRVAFEAAHYVSLGAELYGNPVFNVGDEDQFLESPVPFVLKSLIDQYPTRVAAAKLAVQTGAAIARGEGRIASADYLDLIEKDIKSYCGRQFELTQKQIQEYRDQGD